MARVYEKKPMGERLSKYLVDPFYGRHHPEESKQKISDSKRTNISNHGYISNIISALGRLFCLEDL